MSKENLNRMANLEKPFTGSFLAQTSDAQMVPLSERANKQNSTLRYLSLRKSAKIVDGVNHDPDS